MLESSNSHSFVEACIDLNSTVPGVELLRSYPSVGVKHEVIKTIETSRERFIAECFQPINFKYPRSW